MYICNCGRKFKKKEGLTFHKRYGKCIEKHKCLNCEKETYNPKFCSRSCSVSFNSKGRKHSEETKKKIRESVILSIPTRKPPIKKKYNLSEETKRKISKSLLLKNLANFEERIKNFSYEELSTKDKIRIVFKEIGNKCEKCGYEYTDSNTGKGPYNIHHIDGNKENWKQNNLKVLCLNCHWKTPNYGFKGRTHSKRVRKKLSEVARKKWDNK